MIELSYSACYKTDRTMEGHKREFFFLLSFKSSIFVSIMLFIYLYSFLNRILNRYQGVFKSRFGRLRLQKQNDFHFNISMKSHTGVCTEVPHTAIQVDGIATCKLQPTIFTYLRYDTSYLVIYNYMIKVFSSVFRGASPKTFFDEIHC